jgi:PhzF family phenazine biosynthesis protein
LKLTKFNIDAFNGNGFKGNPACVVPLNKWISDKTLLEIAKTNAVPETAFYVIENNKIYLRWFTPEIEMDLCGHATLATAHCLKEIHNYFNDFINFHTISGEISVKFKNGKYQMSLPKRIPQVSDLPDIISRSLNIQPLECYKSRDYVLVYHSENDINNIIVDKKVLDKINLDPGGVVVTSKGDSVDFVSRYFTPQSSILEDPATGSSHCSLVPLWSQKLNKTKLISHQLSERGGIFECINQDDNIIITGNAKVQSKEILEI